MRKRSLAKQNSLKRDLPSTLPKIELHHGAALWVLSELGFRGNVSKTTFNEYIKSLRKLGLPFKRGAIGMRRRGLANYSYFHMMELVLALTLRVYHVVPDSVLTQIIKYRAVLYRHYERAYSDRWTGMGTPICLAGKTKQAIAMRGIFLDLRMNFSSGKLVKFGPPKLLAPYDAVAIFADRELAARAFLPINLSILAEKLVGAALEAPMIRRGPRPSESNA